MFYKINVAFLIFLYNHRNLHIPTAQKLIAHTPNQSLNILSQNSILEPSGYLYRLINNRLRDLLSRAVRE